MAAIHLFIQYTVPVRSSVPVFTKVLPSVASSAEAGFVSVTTTAGLVPWLKKLAFRAAGAEGIAENVLNAHGKHFGADTAGVAQFVQQQVVADRSSISYQKVDCVNTSGQAFAIWLNVFYLLPLTYLFARFFVRSYLKKKDPRSTKNPAQHAERAGLDALNRVGREIQKAAMEMHGDGISSGTSSGTEDETAATIQAAKANKNKINNNHSSSGDSNSHSKTNTEHVMDTSGRIGTANTGTDTEKRGTASIQIDEQGFSTVPMKRRAKKREAVDSSAGTASASSTTLISTDTAREKENPFVALTKED